MKVFVKTADLALAQPPVVAFHNDADPVPDYAYGDGMTILTLPMSAIQFPTGRFGPHPVQLVTDWQQQSGSIPLAAEAERRIEADFPQDQQILTLRGLVDSILAHGADPAKWPKAAQTARTKAAEKFKYVDEVHERAAAQKTAPRDPAADKNWPKRPAAK